MQKECSLLHFGAFVMYHMNDGETNLREYLGAAEAVLWCVCGCAGSPLPSHLLME